jgi:hypothetical protein
MHDIGFMFAGYVQLVDTGIMDGGDNNSLLELVAGSEFLQVLY